MPSHLRKRAYIAYHGNAAAAALTTISPTGPTAGKLPVTLALPEACREARISQQSYYRWRKEYGGLELDQAKRMKDLERENVRLKRLVADLSLEKQVLKDVASGNL
jgi:putative transposase